MGKKKTHEEYVEELKIKNPTVEVVGKYINAKTKILHRCKTHSVEWFVTPDSVLQGCGCSQCKVDKDIINAKNKRKTHHQYLTEIINKNIQIEPLEEYIDSKTNIRHRCKICKHEWDARPYNILSGYGCPMCSIQKTKEANTKTHDEYIIELFNKNPTVEVIDQYKGANKPIKHYCKIHNIEFYIRPSDALRGSGCKKCQLEKIRNIQVKSHKQYEKELTEMNINIEVVGTYETALTPITHKCLKCGYEWSAIPNNILRGSGCPKCNESHGEKSISSWLNRHKIKFIQQYRFNDCKDKYTLPFDFYLVDYNICIEYQGEQHYRAVDFFGGDAKFKLRQLHDQIKKDYCDNHNIPLLCIRYDENIEEELEKFYSFNIVT
jgi:predicted Zn-ribbon and HTH transcriptional regulator